MNIQEKLEVAKQHSRDTARARARAWANANKSDPFAFQTVMAHYRNGIAGPYIKVGENGKPTIEHADYEVTFDTTKVEGYDKSGNKVMVDRTIPKNMKRP